MAFLAKNSSIPSWLNSARRIDPPALSFHMHDEAITVSSAPGDTYGRYLPYESADLYGDLSGGYYLADLTLERRLVEGFVRGSIIRLFLTSP